MSELIVKSNVPNRTILLDGRYAIVFDENGLGKCPQHLRELLDREMMMRPGRYSVVTAEPPAPLPEVLLPQIEEEVPKVMEDAIDVPEAINMSYLTEEVKPEPKKASKRK